MDGQHGIAEILAWMHEAHHEPFRSSTGDPCASVFFLLGWILAKLETYSSVEAKHSKASIGFWKQRQVTLGNMIVRIHRNTIAARKFPHRKQLFWLGWAQTRSLCQQAAFFLRPSSALGSLLAVDYVSVYIYMYRYISVYVYIYIHAFVYIYI